VWEDVSCVGGLEVCMGGGEECVSRTGVCGRRLMFCLKKEPNFVFFIISSFLVTGVVLRGSAGWLTIIVRRKLRLCVPYGFYVIL